MEVTLRKANAIENLLLETAKGIAIETAVTVSIYGQTPMGTVLENGQTALKDNLALVTALTTSAHTVRDQIGEANDKAGVNSLLRQRAKIVALERIWTGIGKVATLPNVEEAERQLEATAARAAASTERYGRSESLAVSVIGPEIAENITKMLNDARRTKVSIADQLLAINTNTKITLDPFVVALVEKFALV